MAISRQNSRSTSRRIDGAPGDLIGERPVNSFIHPDGRPILHLHLEVLRPPVESAQYLSIRYTQTLTDAGIDPSVGSVGDSYDNALAESIIGLYKTELVWNLGPWNGVDDLELETMIWVHWWNHRRLINRLTPTEREEAHYRHNSQATATAPN